MFIVNMVCGVLLGGRELQVFLVFGPFFLTSLFALSFLAMFFSLGAESSLET